MAAITAQLNQGFFIDVDPALPKEDLVQFERDNGGFFTTHVYTLSLANGENVPFDGWVFVTNQGVFHPIHWESTNPASPDPLPEPSLSFPPPNSSIPPTPAVVPQPALFTPPQVVVPPNKPLVSAVQPPPGSTKASTPTAPVYTVPTSYAPLDLTVATEEEKTDFLKDNGFPLPWRVFVLHPSSKQTTLMVAASHGKLPMVRRLVRDGEDVSQVDDCPGSNKNALQFAVWFKRLDVVRYLLELGKVDYNIKTKEENNLLHLACLRDAQEVVFWLMSDPKRAKKLMVPNAAGDTPEKIANVKRFRVLMHYFASLPK